MADAPDPYRLQRFIDAQEPVFSRVLAELAQGRKYGHWIWFIFPQMKGLGRSSTSEFFGVSSLGEARAYLQHPLLAPRLIKCTELVNAVEGRDAEEIFGDIAEEHDQHIPEGIRPQADGSLNVDGWTPIRELNREFDWDLPDEEATTIAGLVIHEARVIPEVGQLFSFHGFKFEILRRQRNQIMALRLTPPKPEPDDDSG